MSQILVTHDLGGISGLTMIEPAVHGDARGYFMETYNQREMAENGLTVRFVQDNQSLSVRGVLRGLHFQKQFPQGKLVRVVVGEIFDVAVDLRKGSGTFSRWYGERLSEENRKQVYLPEGFAHGFYVLTDEAEFTYKCTDYYNPKAEHSLIWNDETVGIEWPLEGEPSLSAKDLAGKILKDAMKFK